MRWSSGLLAVLVGCGFRLSADGVVDGGVDAPDPDGPVDSAIDTPPAPSLCDPEAGLIVCFSFDAPSLGSSVANEGSAVTAAQLTNVTRIPRGAGGAAEVTTTSLIRIPPNALTTGIVAAEAWVRIDVAPPAGSRIGIMDADATSSALSFFLYDGAPIQIRYEIGQNMYIPYALVLGGWYYLAQVCDNDVLTAYLDGAVLATRQGCTAGNAAPFGLQIGQNNTGTSGDQGLTGAIDGLRLWTTPRTAKQICTAAGLTSC